MTTEEAMQSVYAEVTIATGKHAPMNSHHEAHSVIEEEFDEYWDLVKLNPRKQMVHPTKGTPLTVDEYKTELRLELVQTAAMCVRALHDLCDASPRRCICNPAESIYCTVRGPQCP